MQFSTGAADTPGELSRFAGLHWAHWVVLSLSLVLTIAAWAFSKSQVEAKNRVQFEREADRITALILERMHEYEDGLLGGVGLLRASGGDVSHAQWRTFSDSLKMHVRYPGVNGIGVILSVREAALDDFVARQRIERPDYRVFPAHDQPDRYPIVYVEPVDDNRPAIGLDMAHETTRYTAAKRARDSGELRITGPITLAQDAERTPGFLFYAPFYAGPPPETVEARRAGFRGMVYAPFIVRKLMAGVLGRETRHVGIRISDGEHTLYDEHVPEDPDFDPEPLMGRVQALDLYGRTWSLDIRTDRSFRRAAADAQPLTILIGGLIIDGLLLGLFWILSRSNQRAVAYALQATEELQRKAAHFEKSNRDLEHMAHLVSHDLKAPLRGVKTLIGFIGEDAKEDVEPEVEEHFARIVERVEQMEGLLGDLTSYANLAMRSEVNQPQRIDLKLLVDEICEFNSRDRSRVSVEANGVTPCGDPFLLRAVVNNLIANAFHHGTGPGGETRVELTCDRLDGGMVRIAVRDHGPGVPAGREEEVFEIFRRFGPRQAQGGSGVGLAAVKRIVVNAGGEIWFERPDDGGARCVFTWPDSPE